MSTLSEKIALLSPSLLPKVERFIDSLPTSVNSWNDTDFADSEVQPPPVREDGKPKRRKAGFMKGVIVMHDNFFDPDDDWEEYM